MLTAAVRGLFVPPFVSDGPSLYILDSAGNVVASRVGTPLVWTPRGWGRHQYLRDGAALHDAWCDFFGSLTGGAEDDAGRVLELLTEAWGTGPC